MGRETTGKPRRYERHGETLALEPLHTSPDFRVVDRPQGVVRKLDGRFAKFLHADDSKAHRSIAHGARCTLQDERAIVRALRRNAE